MKFSVERDVLAEAVTWTARSLSPRPPVPVLSGLLLKADNGQVSLAGFCLLYTSPSPRDS